MCETYIKEMGRENISSTPKSAKMPHYGEKRMFSCFGTSIQPRIMILVSNPMFSGTANLKNILLTQLDGDLGVKFQFEG